MSANPSAGPLQAALGFATIEARTPELHFLHQWLDTWHGPALSSPASAARVGIYTPWAMAMALT